jgi:hypothetical protein
MSPGIEARRSTAHQFLLWILPLAFVLHVIEECFLGLVPWAQRMLQPLGMGMEWSGFVVANALALAWGVSGAVVGWRRPGFSLSFPVYMVWNSVFHVGASVLQRELSPWTLTSILLYIPLSVWTLHGAHEDQVLSKRTALQALGINAGVIVGGLAMNVITHARG